MPGKPLIGRDTRLCMSLSARPGNFGTRFHNRLYELTGLDYLYKSFSTTDLPAAIGGIRALSIRGCAISMPFKEAVIPLLDGLGPTAAAIDSVNTIVNDDGRLTGHNTDYAAVVALIAGIDPATRFVLRGSGGMAKAVAAALRDSGFRDGMIVARNEAAGRALAEPYGFDWSAEPTETAPLIVNVTPLGMTGADADALAFPVAMIDACDVALDAVQYPPETPLLREARLRGKRCITGTEIAVLQALEQFILYTGVRPDPAQVEDAAAFARANS
ncbi:shikimate 5-dehydrogenase [Sphingomonas nostoxanthinifaciens]|uniref:shikimate 5-dehydrogenase n=1 Tax=Sphingomonas nostoxanthinifaciens TaxID=2872652 RepID=UPI001CC1FDB2|nr:shikimate 5-dehydrogenase [Sphingomonas nostoxanthinifaciens]UAK24532.1 shikimate 5-dehydrogenase [Sphingomonas nostoxanthinifaciens]